MLFCAAVVLMMVVHLVNMAGIQTGRSGFGPGGFAR